MNRLNRAGRWFFIPYALYLIVFILMTYPAVFKFSTHLYTDTHDGFILVWNLWWVRFSIVHLHQWPIYTQWLYWPQGTWLWGHNTMFFNGLLGIFFQLFLTLTQTHNALLLFSFTTGALGAFFLAYHISRHYVGSILAGFIYGFSNYNFAHAQGHSHLSIIEWIPFSLLAFLSFLKKPSLKRASLCALALLLVALSNLYYLFYTCLALAFLTIAHIISMKATVQPYLRSHRKSFLLFIFLVVSLLGAILFPLIWEERHDPFIIEGHPATMYSTDLLSPIIPGGHWRFASLTKWFWTRLPGNIHESSVHLGAGLIGLLILGWVARRKQRDDRAPFILWTSFALFFFILSLGPALHIMGKEIPHVVLPYRLFEKLVPGFTLSGCPARFMIMVILSTAIMSALSWKALDRGNSTHWTRWRWLLLGIVIFEFWPAPIPCSPAGVPSYVDALANLPVRQDAEGIIDLISPPESCMYYQTVHQRPMAFGYVSRLSKSRSELCDRIAERIRAGDMATLYTMYRFRYLVTNSELDHFLRVQDLKRVYSDGTANIYDLSK